jgi:hypothetical protein
MNPEKYIVRATLEDGREVDVYVPFILPEQIQLLGWVSHASLGNVSRIPAASQPDTALPPSFYPPQKEEV